MKQIIVDTYWEALRELEKIHKSKLILSERIAIERAFAKLESMKRVLDSCNVSLKP